MENIEIARTAAQEFCAGLANEGKITSTLGEFVGTGDHEALKIFAATVKELRNIDSTAKLGGLATLLKRASAETLTYSFSNKKSPFGARIFRVDVVAYEPVEKSQTQLLRAAVRGVLTHAENSIPALRAILDYLDAVYPDWAEDATLRGYADACTARMQELKSA